MRAAISPRLAMSTRRNTAASPVARRAPRVCEPSRYRVRRTRRGAMSRGSSSRARAGDARLADPPPGAARAAAAPRAGKHVLPAEHRPAGHRHAARDAGAAARVRPTANVPYGPSQGLPEFIEALRGYYAAPPASTLDADEIFVTTGGSEAILFVARRDRRPRRRGAGLRAVLHELQRLRARWWACAPCPVTTRAEDGYHLPDRARRSRRASAPRTRAILLCSPNNPTGTVYTDAEMETRGRDLPRARSVPRRRRGLPRVRLRRPAPPLGADARRASSSR